MITVAVVLSVNNCIIGCGRPIYSNVFWIIMTYLTVTKYPPISDSSSEVEIDFKMLQFTCIGPFRRPRAHFEVMIPKKNRLQRNCVLPAQ